MFLLARQLGFSGDSTTGTVVVPSIERTLLSEAEGQLKERGLRYNVQRENSATLAADTVIKQTPVAGAKVAEGSLVTLTVATGSTKPTVPNLVGMTTDQAKSVLFSYGLSMLIQERKDDSVDPGTIVSQEPRAESEVESGATVTVSVAVSSGEKTVPKVDKLSIDEARAALTKEGFLIVVQSEPSNDVEKGLVIRTEPTGGTSVAKGSSVVIISSGGKVVAVPSVIGKDQASATAALEGAGLTVNAKERIELDPAKIGKVVSQTPPEGADADLGTTVFIRVGIPDTATTTKVVAASNATDVTVTESSAPLQTVPTVAPATTTPVVPAPLPVPAAGAPTSTGAAVVVVASSSSA